MNPRERFLAALTFGSPDRVPFEPGWPRKSTLAAWRTQGLAEGADWQRALHAAVGMDPDPPRRPPPALDVDFRLRPQYEEKILEHRDGHYVVQDWKGNVCEISDQFDPSYLRQAIDFVTRRWIRCPVEGRADWEAMKARYAAGDAGRFPPDFAARCAAASDRDGVLTVAVSGPFWQMREWCGFEGLCLLMLEDPELVDEMADFWRRFVADLLDRILAGVVFDQLWISEDMAYKEKAMISPAMTRRYCQPCWRDWTARVRRAGVPLVDVDSDGYIGELIPLWIESGVAVCDPVEVAAGNDLPAYRRRYGRAMAYKGGVDKRAMARGGETLRRELERLAPVVADGGYIPGCDHGVPADVAWPDYVEYAGRLARITGWR